MKEKDWEDQKSDGRSHKQFPRLEVILKQQARTVPLKQTVDWGRLGRLPNNRQ